MARLAAGPSRRAMASTITRCSSTTLFGAFHAGLGVQPSDAQLGVQVTAVPLQVGVLADVEDGYVEVIGEFQYLSVWVALAALARGEHVVHLGYLAL